jgi:hypothetical protein
VQFRPQSLQSHMRPRQRQRFDSRLQVVGLDKALIGLHADYITVDNESSVVVVESHHSRPWKCCSRSSKKELHIFMDDAFFRKASSSLSGGGPDLSTFLWWWCPLSKVASNWVRYDAPKMAERPA